MATINSVQFNNETPASLSLINGYQFNFRDGDVVITPRASAWSGKEVVVVNGREVSSKRLLHKLTSTHEFEHDGSSYRVVFKVINMLTSEVECTVYRGELQIGHQRKGMIEKPFTSFTAVFMFGLYIVGVLSLGTAAATAVTCLLSLF